MSIRTITKKGQITIPIEIRNALGLKAGDRINSVSENGRVILFSKTKNITSLKGMIDKPKISVTLEYMKESIKSK